MAYTKNVWQTSDVITAEKLNNNENQVELITNELEAIRENMVTIDDTLTITNTAADAKVVGDKIAELNEIIIPDNYIPELTDDATRVNNYVITEDGTVTSNNMGYYLQDIQVIPGERYTISAISNGATTTNTRIHGYNNNNWQAQLAIIAKNNEYVKTITFSVPSNVNNIKISTSTTEYISLKSINYGFFDLLDENVFKHIQPIGSFDGIINDIGIIQSSNTSKVFYAPVHSYEYYIIKRQINSINSGYVFTIAEYDSLPTTGSTSLNFNSGNKSQLALNILADGYIAWSYSGNQNADIFDVLLSIKNYTLNVLPEVTDIIKKVNVPDNFIPELTDTATRTNGYIISADGVITENGAGYYLQNIPVKSDKKYIITVTSNGGTTTNTRIHGYNDTSWQAQLAVISKNNEYVKTATIEIPSNINNIKIGTTATEYISIKQDNYGIFELLDENDFEPIQPIGNIDGIIDGEGIIQSSNTAKVFYAPANRFGYYVAKRQIESYSNYNVFAIAEFDSLPTVGDTSFNFSIGKNESQLTLKARSNNYIAWSYSGNQNADIFNVLLNIKKYVLNAIPHSTKDLIVNMGNPYTYLSSAITDEILDNTTVSDVYAIYDALVTAHPEFVKRMDDIGTDPSGLPMRLYRIGWQQPWMVGTGHEASWSEANNIYDDNLYGYQKIFINAGTHGNEKSSVYGVALSIQEIVNSTEPWALYIKGNFILDVCPVACPWGYNNTSRNSYGDVNVNRDFLRRTRPESQAIYNLLKNGGYHAAIDSHNSGGNANYFGITNSNPLLKTYVQMNFKLAGIVYESWDALATGEAYAVKPYMQCWTSAPIGMMQDMFNELGIPGYLIESVGVFKNGIGILTPNHKKYCKFTKDLLINSIIALGSTRF